MSDRDFAVVVGISRYPTLRAPAPGSSHDLQGPDADSEAVHQWLTDPKGGAVPPGQAFLINSARHARAHAQMAAMQPGPNPMPPDGPTRDQMEGAFRWIIDQHRRRRRIHLGRRLYVFFSGHGFAMRNADGGVYDAAASPDWLSHFYVGSWFDWFYRSAMFEEFVLWVDACADSIPISSPSPAFLPVGDSPDMADGRCFVAYSAKRGRLSVERQDGNGQVHGVFTMALLDGLKGGARDPDTGRVTADGLARHLERTMGGFMTDADRDNPDIGKEPAIGQCDDLEFGPRIAPAPAPAAAGPGAGAGARAQDLVPVTLRFGARHEGQPARVLDNALQEVAAGVVEGGAWSLRLPLGLFKAVIAATDGAQLFEVNGRPGDAAFIS